MLGYTGEFLDAVTGGYPPGNGYRLYLPGLMRFNAPDESSPFGVGGVNSYTYCADDPINGSDPTGHMLELETAAALLEGEDFEGNEHYGLKPVNPQPETGSSLSGEEPEPSSSGTSLAAAHANTSNVAPMSELGKTWLNSVIEGVKTKQIPTDDAGLTQLFNQAYMAGQITLNPDGQARLTRIFSWKPEIVLNGKLLAKNDSKIAQLMRRYGATYEGGGRRPENVTYTARLLYDADSSKAIAVTLGVEVVDQPPFSPIILKDHHKQVSQRLTRAIGTRARKRKLAVQYLDGSKKYSQLLDT
jgi:RHS repeat-associated protein